uniref:probable WRKY transcription factor protein 1 n=1 Tax=Styela clava TaxID=7725 RepID=UPI0019393A74|nr:probable WRKY transcription factor protein 1 [Styela clava]
MVSYQQTASVRSDMATEVGQKMEDGMDVVSEYNMADNMDNSKFGKNMTNDIKVGQNMEDEMDKLLEEFLMPPPEGTPRSFVLRNSLESLRDASSTSLDRSGNSSSTTGSWNSSCSCHSMSSLSQSKSAFVFHKQAILPPLLCSSSRTEMKVYKMKAVEREQRRKEKEKQRLISRVEAILSSVEVSPMKNKKPLIQSIKESHTISVQPSNIPQQNFNQLDNAIDTNSDRDLQNVSDVISSSHDKQCSDDETMQSEDDITHKQNLSNCDITEQNNSHENDFTNHHDNNDTENSENTSDHHGDSDDVASSDDNAAYRSSLRNLLQKSMNLSQSGIVNSPCQSKTETVENIEQESATSTKSSSESDADITENAVVEMKAKEDKIFGQNEQKDKNTPDFASNVLKTEEATQNDSNFVPESENLSQEDILVESIVQTAIKDAKNQLDNENSMKPLSPNNDNCDVENDSILFLNNQLNDLIKQNKKIIPRVEKTDNSLPKDISDEISSWETPKITKVSEKTEISPLSVTDSQFFELHNQSTSTKVNYPLDGVGEQIPDGGLETSNYSNKIKIDSSPILPNETEITNHNEIVELQGEFCYKSTIIEACPVAEETVSEVQHNCDDVTITDDLTVLKPVMSDTVSDVTMTIDDETMKENCDPTMETGSLISIKRSLSFTLDQPSPEFESAVIEAVSQHFHGNKDEEMMNKHLLDAVGPVLEIDSNAPLDEIAVAKRKMMLQQRVRRGSYTLEEPSPYLIKNKEKLM